MITLRQEELFATNIIMQYHEYSRRISEHYYIIVSES